MKSLFKTLFFATTLALTLAACGDDDDHSSNIHLGGDTEEQTTQKNASADLKARLEMPAPKTGNIFVSHATLEGSDSVVTYSYEFDPAKNHTRWVAWRFDNKTRKRYVARGDAWSDDPALPTSMRIGTTYFDGYNRGHICPSADRLYSRQANDLTFYMSNMSPQIGDFNAGIWADMENHVRNLGQSPSFCDTLYIVRGGTIRDDQLKGYINRPNGLKMAVPKYYFSVALRVKNNTYAAIGFWFEHRAYGEGADIAAQVVSIDNIEEKTGIDFFHNLPDKVEAVVESTVTPSLWGL